MTPQPPAAPGTSQAMAITALVLAILGVCLILPLPFALVLAIIVIATNRAGKGLAIGALVVCLVSVPVAGILAAVAIPNFIKFSARTKAAECKANLKMAWVAARSYQGEHDGYVTELERLGFSPEPGNRYLYTADSAGRGMVRADPRHGTVQGDGLGVIHELVDVGLSGTCPKCQLTIACAGNIDTDDTLDVWSISTGERAGPDGPIPAGKPFHHLDDISDHREPHVGFPQD